jgi:hypothetical protein
VVVYAGPCEEGCEYNRTQCNNDANQAYNGCLAIYEEERSVCNMAAAIDLESCMRYRPLDACNFEYEMALRSCDNSYDQNKVQCDWTLWMDQASCNNDYENCLFVCSSQ